MIVKFIIKTLFVALSLALLLFMKTDNGQKILKQNESKLNFYTAIYFFIGGAIMFGI